MVFDQKPRKKHSGQHRVVRIYYEKSYKPQLRGISTRNMDHGTTKLGRVKLTFWGSPTYSSPLQRNARERPRSTNWEYWRTLVQNLSTPAQNRMGTSHGRLLFDDELRWRATARYPSFTLASNHLWKYSIDCDKPSIKTRPSGQAGLRR